jgi:hypothetical protein
VVLTYGHDIYCWSLFQACHSALPAWNTETIVENRIFIIPKMLDSNELDKKIILYFGCLKITVFSIQHTKKKSRDF